MTTKAKAGGAGVKGVCKESLETLMRTAEKMNKNHVNASTTHGS